MMDYWFDSRPKNAAFWATKEAAENDCVIFNYPFIVGTSGQAVKS
jgi:hypothetical protein